MDRPRRNRIVIKTTSAPAQSRRRTKARQPDPRGGEAIIAISVIGAAAFATFLALFVTSRPYNPMYSSVEPSQTLPQGSLVTIPSPKPSPSTTPTPPSQRATPESPEPSGGTTTPAVDDASIQSAIERALAADPALSQLDVSTIVESGKVTIVGAVKSAELKQRVGRVIGAQQGVASVDNQLVVIQPTP